jgi:hypothetical protein
MLGIVSRKIGLKTKDGVHTHRHHRPSHCRRTQEAAIEAVSTGIAQVTQ